GGRGRARQRVPETVLRAPDLLPLRHPWAGARTHPVLVQQSAGRLPRMQRFRRGARVRRITDRPRPGPLARRGGARSLDQAALRRAPPAATGDGARTTHPPRYPVARPRGARAALLAARGGRRRALSGHAPVSPAAPGEAL